MRRTTMKRIRFQLDGENDKEYESDESFAIPKESNMYSPSRNNSALLTTWSKCSSSNIDSPRKQHHEVHKALTLCNISSPPKRMKLASCLKDKSVIRAISMKVNQSESPNKWKIVSIPY